MLLYYGYYGFDPTYILVIVAAVISLFAQMKVQSNFNRYKGVQAKSGMTGAEVAERILHSQGLYDVSIERVRGNLTDHYDPSAKVLRLSDSVYASSSVAAIGVAAHECGHAVQHDTDYAPIGIRSAIVPVANIGSKLSWILIIVGLIIGGSGSSVLLTAGILCFTAVVAFHLVTLPVEYDASGRALVMLRDMGILDSSEIGGAKKVLGAAALTYVASAATAILQLLRLIIIAGGRNRD